MYFNRMGNQPHQSRLINYFEGTCFMFVKTGAREEELATRQFKNIDLYQ